MSIFEQTTKVALEEIVKEGCDQGKFGYFLSEESLQEIVEQLYGFLLTSRELKSSGDMILSGRTSQ